MNDSMKTKYHLNVQLTPKLNLFITNENCKITKQTANRRRIKRRAKQNEPTKSDICLVTQIYIYMKLSNYSDSKTSPSSQPVQFSQPSQPARHSANSTHPTTKKRTTIKLNSIQVVQKKKYKFLRSMNQLRHAVQWQIVTHIVVYNSCYNTSLRTIATVLVRIDIDKLSFS